MKVTLAILLLIAGTASTYGQYSEPDLTQYFEDRGINGTFVLYDLQSGQHVIHNPERAEKQFIPASTFKILHSLIALETGVIADTSTVLLWDGEQREIRSWNRDHSMMSAFRNSVVWYYQETARHIGENRMHDYVSHTGYGNNNTGSGIDQFWLTGNLRISALEQIDFLVRLHNADLPFSERAMETVKAVMAEEHTDRCILYAKTGWARWTPADIGWYVGYMECGKSPLFFALNMDIEHLGQTAERKNITLEILKELGWM